jgi:hypothetical protein
VEVEVVKALLAHEGVAANEEANGGGGATSLLVAAKKDHEEVMCHLQEKD